MKAEKNVQQEEDRIEEGRGNEKTGGNLNGNSGRVRRMSKPPLNDEPMKFMHSEHYRQGHAVGGDDVVDERRARRRPRRSTMAS